MNMQRDNCGCLEVGILLSVLVPCLIPGLDGLTTPDDNMEKRVLRSRSCRLHTVAISASSISILPPPLQKKDTQNSSGIKCNHFRVVVSFRRYFPIWKWGQIKLSCQVFSRFRTHFWCELLKTKLIVLCIAFLDGPAIRNANRGDSRESIRAILTFERFTRIASNLRFAMFWCPEMRFTKKGGQFRNPQAIRANQAI